LFIGYGSMFEESLVTLANQALTFTRFEKGFIQSLPFEMKIGTSAEFRETDTSSPLCSTTQSVKY
jgi:hypothetical protein